MTLSYPLTPPSSPGVQEMALQFVPSTGMSRSLFTGKPQSYSRDGVVWSASITLPPLHNLTKAREWHGFLVALNGYEGTFLMAPPRHQFPQGTQSTGFDVRSATSIRATELPVKNMDPGATLLRGDLISVANRLYMVVESVTADGSGDADLKLSHGLRAAAANNDSVSVNSPVGTWRLAEELSTRRIGLGGVSTISFAIQEAAE